MPMTALDKPALRPVKIGRYGTRSLYLGPNGSAMRYSEAKAALARVHGLRSDLSREIAFSKATGFGDHAKVTRLIAEIEAATRRTAS